MGVSFSAWYSSFLNITGLLWHVIMHYYRGPSLITPRATFGPRGVDYTLGVDYEACHENTAVSHYESLKVCFFFFFITWMTLNVMRDFAYLLWQIFFSFFFLNRGLISLIMLGFVKDVFYFLFIHVLIWENCLLIYKGVFVLCNDYSSFYFCIIMQ